MAVQSMAVVLVLCACGYLLAAEDQAVEPNKAMGQSTATADVELLGFRECMPVLFADKKEKMRMIRDSMPKWGYVKDREQYQRNIFAVAQNLFSEYEAYTLRILKLAEKAKADTNNEKLQEEIKAQTKEIHRIRGKWLLETIKHLELLSKEHADFTKIDSVHSLLGEALWWSGKDKEALKVLRDLIKKYPKSKELPRAYMFFGEYYLKKGEPDKAREAFGKASVVKGHDCAPCAAYRTGHCHRLSGDTGKAVEWFEKAALLAGKGSPVRAFSERALRLFKDMAPAGKKTEAPGKD